MGSLANSCPSLQLTVLLSAPLGRAQESRKQGGETGEVEKVRKPQGARVVGTTQTSSVTGEVQMLLLPPTRASSH